MGGSLVKLVVTRVAVAGLVGGWEAAIIGDGLDLHIPKAAEIVLIQGGFQWQPVGVLRLCDGKANLDRRLLLFLLLFLLSCLILATLLGFLYGLRIPRRRLLLLLHATFSDVSRAVRCEVPTS